MLKKGRGFHALRLVALISKGEGHRIMCRELWFSGFLCLPFNLVAVFFEGGAGILLTMFTFDLRSDGHEEQLVSERDSTKNGKGIRDILHRDGVWLH